MKVKSIAVTLLALFAGMVSCNKPEASQSGQSENVSPNSTEMRRRASRMPARQRIRFSGERIFDLYSQWPKPQEAAKWRATL